MIPLSLYQPMNFLIPVIPIFSTHLTENWNEWLGGILAVSKKLPYSNSHTESFLMSRESSRNSRQQQLVNDLRDFTLTHNLSYFCSFYFFSSHHWSRGGVHLQGVKPPQSSCPSWVYFWIYSKKKKYLWIFLQDSRVTYILNDDT